MLNMVRRWPSPDARSWAEHVFPELCENPSVLAVVLLGSAVREVDSSFDLDCIYIYEGKGPKIARSPIEVDVRSYAADTVDELICNGHDLLGWSVKFGKLVCERNGFWTRLVGRWAARLPLPSPKVAEERAQRAGRLYNELVLMGDEDAATELLVTALTHQARAALLRENVFPASRPELPGQLSKIGETTLAKDLSTALRKRSFLAHQLANGRSAGGAARP